MTSPSLACSSPNCSPFLCHFKIPKKGKVAHSPRRISQLSGHGVTRNKQKEAAHKQHVILMSEVWRKTGTRREHDISEWELYTAKKKLRFIFFFFFLHPRWVEDPIPFKMWLTAACAKALPAINLTHHCTFSQLFLINLAAFFPPRPSLFYFSLSVSHFHPQCRDKRMMEEGAEDRREGRRGTGF